MYEIHEEKRKELQGMIEDLDSSYTQILDLKYNVEKVKRNLMSKLLQNNMVDCLSINFQRLRRVVNPNSGRMQIERKVRGSI